MIVKVTPISEANKYPNNFPVKVYDVKRHYLNERMKVLELVKFNGDRQYFPITSIFCWEVECGKEE